MPDTISELRASLDDGQRAVLNTIWDHYCDQGEWPLVKVIHHNLGTPDVRAALGRLPQGVVLQSGYTLNARYELSFAGSLLTDAGSEVEARIAGYLRYLCDRWQEDPTLQRVTSEELRQGLNLSPQDTGPLGRIIQLSDFWGGGSFGGERWDVTLPNDIDDLAGVPDFQTYIRERAASQVTPQTSIASNQPRYTPSAILEMTSSDETAENNSVKTDVFDEELRSSSNYEHATCFVLMPFEAPFNGYYGDIIKLAIEAVGLRAVRADELSKPGAIAQQIWREINSARVCIAELTGRNPNVMYELGLAHALGKPVVQIVQDMDDVPFDLRHLRHIVYSTQSARWSDELREKLEESLRATLQDPSGALAFPPMHMAEEPSDIVERVNQRMYHDQMLRVPLP